MVFSPRVQSSVGLPPTLTNQASRIVSEGKVVSGGPFRLVLCPLSIKQDSNGEYTLQTLGEVLEPFVGQVDVIRVGSHVLQVGLEAPPILTLIADRL